MAQTFYTTKLNRIYDADLAANVEARLLALVDSYRGQIPIPPDTSLSERDSILITYGDQVQDSLGRGQARMDAETEEQVRVLSGHPRPMTEKPLQTLAEFCEAHLRDVVSGIHILPFYPWSSDDGFSVKDYREVDSALGGWRDVERLGHSFRLMFDGVINHASAQGTWFQSFLRDEAPYRDYFLTVEGDPDLSQVVRPRTLPLLTEYQTASGPRRVWTTFSPDQVDLDFRNPEILLEIFDILLMYAQRGAQFIRLDAIAFLWKQIGTSCLHLPQTHAVIQLLRAVLDDVAPHVRLITETNVPHADNISYFGDGENEAQLVYNFALPPLVLHTLRTGDATVLSEWARGLDLPSDQTTFFNFLASHDGIGLNPARGILSPAEIDALIEQTLAHGGLISYKHNADGTQSPYEMNINYFDPPSPLSCRGGVTPPLLETQIGRFMAAQAIMLSLRGVPGIYFHSLFGSRNWQAGVELTQHNRTINREKLERSALESELADPNSLRAQVFGRFRQRLVMRAASPAFHPHGGQQILDVDPGVFGVLRTSPDGAQQMTCLQNVTAQAQSALGHTLAPYQTLWI